MTPESDCSGLTIGSAISYALEHHFDTPFSINACLRPSIVHSLSVFLFKLCKFVNSLIYNMTDETHSPGYLSNGGVALRPRYSTMHPQAVSIYNTERARHLDQMWWQRTRLLHIDKHSGCVSPESSPLECVLVCSRKPLL